MPLSGPERFHQVVSQGIVSNGRFDDYLHQLTARLLAAAREVARDPASLIGGASDDAERFSPDLYRVELIAADVSNVYSAGGRRIYLTSALVADAEDEDELAAAIAYTLAHLLLNQTDARAGLALQGGSPPVLALRLAEHRYAPVQQQRAHELAFAIHLRAGWEPGRYVSVWESAPAGGSFLSILKARLERLPPIAWEYARPPIADERWFDELQGEVKALAPTTEGAFAAEVLAALPSPFAEGAEAQLAARQSLMRQVNTRALAPTSLTAGNR